MKKCWILAALLLAAFVLPAFAAAPAAPTAEIKLGKGKKIVSFKHETHKAIACVDCHHKVDGKEDYRSCATAGCHDNFDQKDKSINSFYQIAHKAKGAKFETCVSCHVKTAGADNEKKKSLAGCAKSVCHP